MKNTTTNLTKQLYDEGLMTAGVRVARHNSSGWLIFEPDLPMPLILRGFQEVVGYLRAREQRRLYTLIAQKKFA